MLPSSEAIGQPHQSAIDPHKDAPDEASMHSLFPGAGRTKPQFPALSQSRYPFL